MNPITIGHSHASNTYKCSKHIKFFSLGDLYKAAGSLTLVYKRAENIPKIHISNFSKNWLSHRDTVDCFASQELQYGLGSAFYSSATELQRQQSSTTQQFLEFIDWNASHKCSPMLLGFSVVNLWYCRVAPSSRYTPVVISTSTTSHLWKKKKGLVLVVSITTYQPRLVFALKTADLGVSYRGLAAHTLQHRGRAGQPHTANWALKGTLKIRYTSEKVLHSFWLKPTKIISEFQELELGDQCHRTTNWIQWVAQLNSCRFQPFWNHRDDHAETGRIWKVEGRGGNETGPLPGRPQWSFTSWKVKVFFWNPKRKDFKTVR